MKINKLNSFHYKDIKVFFNTTFQTHTNKTSFDLFPIKQIAKRFNLQVACYEETKSEDQKGVVYLKYATSFSSKHF